MAFAKLLDLRPGRAGTPFDLQQLATPAPTAATPRRRVLWRGDPTPEPGRDSIVQAAARLKLMLSDGRRLVAVAGIEAKDGGTMLTARLAVAMGQLDQARVLVVDGNVSESRLAGLFDISSGPGLLDVLAAHAALATAIRPVAQSNLHVLPLGTADRSLASLLTSSAGAALIATLREQFRYVIIDAGNVGRDPGGMLLASLADGVVMAVGIGKRRRDEIVRSQEELQRLNIPLFGVVLTRAS